MDSKFTLWREHLRNTQSDSNNFYPSSKLKTVIFNNKKWSFVLLLSSLKSHYFQLGQSALLLHWYYTSTLCSVYTTTLGLTARITPVMLDFNPKNRRNFRDPQIAQFDWLKSHSIVLIGGSHSKILFFCYFLQTDIVCLKLAPTEIPC